MLEPDARDVPWSDLERLALEGGRFPPRVQPLSEGELADLLDRAAPGLGSAGDDTALLHFWRARYERGGGLRAWRGCTCRVDPPELRLRARLVGGWCDLGEPVPGEAGLTWGPGAGAAPEVAAELTAGRWWFAASGRWAGRAGLDGTTLGPDDPLAWPGWPTATGRAQVRRARLDDGRGRLDAPRAVAGVRLGRWALSGGWAPRRTGPGLSGGLLLDRGGASFPALTARRTRPFRWRGVMAPLAPDDLLLRAGTLSHQDIRYYHEAGISTRRARPWFFQWLVGWEVVPWLRVALSHVALASADEGSLWLDVPQINFPVVGTTWTEKEAGPATERLFALQLEGRWRDAPWPVLPARAGRVWWEYAGTDFHPSGPGGVFPEIAAPASVAGIALYDPVWDLACEYAELVHEKILWYANAGFPEGVSHRGWLLAHPLGGSGESVSVRVRVRPRGARLEAGLTGVHRTWGRPGLTPGEGDQWELAGSLRRLPAAGSRRLWTVHASWVREAATPYGGRGSRRDAWRAWLTFRLP